MSSHDPSLRRVSPRSRNRPSPPKAAAASHPALVSLNDTPSFKNKAYAALKNAIVAMDIYRSRDDIRLDERKLAQDFGISRTPVREAMAQLESEGFVRSVPRRGIYVVRKTKREVIEMITAWAALESMAARLMTEVATRGGNRRPAPDVRHLRERQGARPARRIFRRQHRIPPDHHPDERATRVLIDLAENLFTHMRMIRRKTIGEKDRADRSIRDHISIIEALEARATDRAEGLVRDHALGLAEHVARYADYLD